MSERSYGQYCGLAAALDAVGDRWSMLLVRNLLVGPQRFSDLAEGMPGLSTGLLSTRLKALEQAGVAVKRQLPPPAASTVYDLTEEGRRLAPAVLELARWGMHRLEESQGQHFDAVSLALGLWARLDGSKAQLPDGDIALTIDGRPFDIATSDGGSTVSAGTPAAPRATVVTDSRTLAKLSDGTSTLANALGEGRLTVDGAPESVAQLTAALGLTP